MVELRLFKASLSSPEDSSDAITVREINDPKTSLDVSPIIVDPDVTDDGSPKSSPRHALYHSSITQHFLEKTGNSESSFADSGHFEDLTTFSTNSKDSYKQTRDVACGSDDKTENLVKMYEEKIEALIKCQNEEKQEARNSQSRVEGLLIKLAECNELYADLVPDYEQAKEKIRELEKQLEDLQKKLQEQEDKQNKMYLHMFTKGQESDRIRHADNVRTCEPIW